MVLVRYVVGYRSCSYDSNGVVGCTYVDECHEHGDAHLSASLAVDATCEEVDDIVYSSVVAYDGEHAAGEDGDDDEFSHSHHSLVHG